MAKWITPKIIMTLAITSLVASNAYAVAEGLYAGIMLGPAYNSGANAQAQVAFTNNRVTTLPPTVTVTARTKQFGTRIYVGYKMNLYASVESGITAYSVINYKNPTQMPTCTTLSSHVQVLDFLGKGEFSIYNFEAFIKAGVAATYLRTDGAFNNATPASPTPPPFAMCGQSKKTISPRPTVSLGVSYDMTQNWVADFAWTRVWVGNIVQNISLYTLGISYHFVDRYCGQFLCDD